MANIGVSFQFAKHYPCVVLISGLRKNIAHLQRWDGELTVQQLTLFAPTLHGLTNVNDNFKFCNWKEDSSEGDAIWDLADVRGETINDIEGWVPTKLQAD